MIFKKMYRIWSYPSPTNLNLAISHSSICYPSPTEALELICIGFSSRILQCRGCIRIGEIV
ncbi:hypothetical protein M758_5G123200 [Ceratodon purpureus]|nr:hypothetical protein M758_5G123200 [Ceratodon purpureus]